GFKGNRKVYLEYSAPRRASAPSDWDSTLHVSEFKASEADPARVDPSSERVLLEIDKPWFNHNAGCLAFGPDGYLYISVGDGGNANDEGRGHSPQGNGQDTTVLLGKILRIDVDKGNPYAIPADNPFADGKKGRPEIFAYGMRNAWRISFDRGGSHELFAGDVGQTMYEEVDIIVKVGNYGFADWSRKFALPDGALFAATRPGSAGEKKWTMEPLELVSPKKLGVFVVAFGQDAEGELYLLTNGRNMITGNTGKVYKL